MAEGNNTGKEIADKVIYILGGFALLMGMPAFFGNKVPISISLSILVFTFLFGLLINNYFFSALYNYCLSKDKFILLLKHLKTVNICLIAISILCLSALYRPLFDKTTKKDFIYHLDHTVVLNTTPVKKIKEKNIDSLLNTPILATKGIYKKGTNQYEFESCKDYFMVSKLNLDFPNSERLKLDSLKTICEVLRHLRLENHFKTTNRNNIYGKPNKLPIELLSPMTRNHDIEVDSLTLKGETFEDHNISYTVKNNNLIVLHRGFKYEIKQYLKGDFNNDHKEDILVIILSKVIGGTYSQTKIQCLSWDPNESKFITIET